MATSITISNLDDQTFRLLQLEAARTGSDPESVAKTALVKGLAEVQPAPKMPEGPPYHDLDHLAGTWSEEDAKRFMEAIAEFGIIEPEEWQ